MKIIARNDLRQVVGGGGDNSAGNPVVTDGISYDDSTGNHID